MVGQENVGLIITVCKLFEMNMKKCEKFWPDRLDGNAFVYEHPLTTSLQNLYHISEQLDVRYAAQTMVKGGVKRLLVVDNNKLEGILTMTDILGVLLESVKEVEDS